MQFKGRVEEGKLAFDNPKRLAQYVSGLSGDVAVTIAPWKIKRTDKQNDLYWAILTEIGSQTGYTKEELHEVCKKLFNLKIVCVANEIYEVGGSTTRLSTKEFGEYVRQVEQWALDEFQLVINENEI